MRTRIKRRWRKKNAFETISRLLCDDNQWMHYTYIHSITDGERKKLRDLYGPYLYTYICNSFDKKRREKNSTYTAWAIVHLESQRKLYKLTPSITF